VRRRSKCLDVRNTAAAIFFVVMYDIGGYGPIILITLWTEAAIALVFVCMRLWTRIKINRVVGWDDYLISFSCVSYNGKTSPSIY
jgi:hypothetical protein